MDPLKIERLYGQINSEIQRAGSERVQLFNIHRFLEEIKHEYQQYDTYVIQLFDLFPAIDHPLLFTGITPKKLKTIIHDCKEAVRSIPELETDRVLLKKLDYLDAGLHHIYHWLGIHENGVDQQNQLAINEGFSDSEHKENIGDVFVPVVEQLSNYEISGRLRKLKVEIVGNSRSNYHELKPVFGVIGAHAGDLGLEAAQAAGELLSESSDNQKFWSATASFELNHAWHTGNSANLALSSLFYCEMLKAENRREYFRINPGIAITGNIDGNGKVMDVGLDTLQQKAEAAFFSWAQVLVVPESQYETVRGYLEILNKEYPERHLVLRGIGHLKELFFDRRLTLYHQVSLLEHTATKVWKKRYSAVTLVTVLVLLGVIGKLVYGPIDKNPVSLVYENNIVKAHNSSGNILQEILVGDYTNYGTRSGHEAVEAYFDLIDADGDGINEILWSTRESEGNDRIKLFLSEVSGDTVWHFNYSEELDYEFHPYTNSGQQNIERIGVSDIDGDGSEEVIVLTRHEDYFPSYLLILNAEDASIEKKYLHQGEIIDFIVGDFNKDQKKEIVIGGLNNSFRRAFIAVIDHSLISGQGVSSNKYKTSNYRDAKETIYVMFPKTIPTEKAEARSGFATSVHGINYFEEPDRISVQIAETSHLEDNAILTYIFEKDFTLRSIGSSNAYDKYMKSLYVDGEIDIIADGKYLLNYKDSLLWWNGESFQHEPTLNKAYQRTTEDSSE